MEGPITERDWKYLRSIHDEMLYALCLRINEKAVAIANVRTSNPHKQYLELFHHMEKSESIVAECFNDWRRSGINLTILSLRRHGLLLDSHVQNLSRTARDWLIMVEEMERGNRTNRHPPRTHNETIGS
jgi:hypothetical protein